MNNTLYKYTVDVHAYMIHILSQQVLIRFIYYKCSII